MKISVSPKVTQLASLVERDACAKAQSYRHDCVVNKTTLVPPLQFRVTVSTKFQEMLQGNRGSGHIRESQKFPRTEIKELFL